MKKIFLIRVLNSLPCLRESGYFSHRNLDDNAVYLLIQFVPDPRFEEVKEYVRSGVFGSYNYDDLIGSLEGNEGFGRADYFLVGKDFPSYLECQEEVDEAYRDQKVSLCTFSYYELVLIFLPNFLFFCTAPSPHLFTTTKLFSTMCSTLPFMVQNPFVPLKVRVLGQVEKTLP